MWSFANIVVVGNMSEEDISMLDDILKDDFEEKVEEKVSPHVQFVHGDLRFARRFNFLWHVKKVCTRPRFSNCLFAWVQRFAFTKHIC